MAEDYYQSTYTGTQIDTAIGRIVSGDLDKLVSNAEMSAAISQSNANSAKSASESAQNAYNGIQEAISNIPEGSTPIVNDLTTGGTKAALSAEQGKVLDGKIDGLTASDVGAAPAGYGLGGGSKRLTSSDDLDAIWENGWYEWSSDTPANTPFNYGIMEVKSRQSNIWVQEITQVLPVTSSYPLAGVKVQRIKYVDSISPWEYVNPPIETNKEYRTTERYLGKPVYVKSVSLGYMPNATMKTVAHGIQGVLHVISVYGHMNDVYMASGSHYGYISNVWADNTNIYVKTTADLSSMFGYVVLKYVK